MAIGGPLQRGITSLILLGHAARERLRARGFPLFSRGSKEFTCPIHSPTSSSVRMT
jgi:hypothetical protein